MNTKFITNQNGQTLYDRFTALIKNTQYFDILVGYFYLSGFYKLEASLNQTDKIRILVGMETDDQIIKLNQRAVRELDFISSSDAKLLISDRIKNDLENSEDNYNTYSAALKFIDWIKQGKIEVRLYKKQKIHSKIYIMTFPEGFPDRGRVITGSSNFTQSGLINNIEYNIELRDDDDYEFAKSEFEKLWLDSVPLEEQFVETINTETWVSDSITPYYLYLKFLYEHFREDLSLGNVKSSYRSEWHKDLEYQKQAVLSARKILETYGGVFIADVVGLGKTIMGALLLLEYPYEKSLIIAPPHLISGWEDVNIDYRLSAKIVSLGKLEELIKSENLDEYTTVIIDEAHRFRNEHSQNYLHLAEVCRGKRVILLSATPYNNKPSDLLALVKLFQSGRDANIPNLRNVEKFLNNYESEIKKLKKAFENQELFEEDYYAKLKEIAIDIRERLLQYIMIRRTRDEIIAYFQNDLSEANFPTIHKPIELYYLLNTVESYVFNKTITYIKELRYARYKIIAYLKNKPKGDKLTIVNNLAGFMKTLLVKRLESSQHAFRQTIDNFISAHEHLLKLMREQGEIYVSKKISIDKISELTDSDGFDEIEQLILSEQIERHSIEDVEESFVVDLEYDLALLHKIKNEWQKVERDIKLNTFIAKLAELLNQHEKLIIFTEAADTANYLSQELSRVFRVLCVSGANAKALRQNILDNFSTNTHYKRNDYDVLIATDVLSEGVSFQRANAIVNYDIPWNPTRMMQRIGRINRVDSLAQELFVYNFFPSDESDEQINLTNNAKAKISVFIELLGTDSHTLTGDETLGGKGLFAKLTKVNDAGEIVESESELLYLNEIKAIRDNDPVLFDKIKKLPKKAKTQRKSDLSYLPMVLTYFRQGRMQKYITSDKSGLSHEYNFVTMAKLLKANPEEASIRGVIDEQYFTLLANNKSFYNDIISIEELETGAKGSKDPASKLLTVLRGCKVDRRQFTEEQDMYYKRFIDALTKGDIPKEIAKKIQTRIAKVIEERHIINALEVLDIILDLVPHALMQGHRSKLNTFHDAPQEIILSEYLVP
jgi:superfamily II DNA or RNA helicase